jgi:phage/plasmid-associated DNA primase
MQNPEIDTPKHFNWTLSKECTKSIFLKKKMEEFTDIKMVNGFIDNKLGNTYQGDCKYAHIRYKTELDQMQDYKKNYNHKNQNFSTAYISAKHKWGRITPVNYLSLSIMRRQTRHSLCDGIYADIDMVNAQPSALYSIAKQNDLDLPNLKLYVDDPKKYRTMIMEHHDCNKDVSKSLPITIMMGGSYSGWLKENDIQTKRENNEKMEFIVNLENELKIATNIVYCSNKHIEKDVLRQEPTKWKTEAECKRGVMGLWSQTVEKMFQECAINYLVNEKNFKLEQIVPCQDGFMILKDLYYENLINECNEVISSTYGIDMKFILKPFDEKIEIPIFEGGKTVFEWNDLLSATKLNERLLEEYGDYIIKYKQQLFVYYGNRWYEETVGKQRHHLVRYICENLYNLMAADINADIGLEEKERQSLLTTLRVNTSARSRIADIEEKTIAYCKERKEDFNLNPYLLGFDNGVFDLTNNVFREYKYDDYMTMSVNYNYEKPDYSNESVAKLREEVIQFIESIHPDVEYRTIYMQILASGLDGRAYQNLFLFNGQGGNGKGSTAGLMDIILGDYYHQPTNGILTDLEKANVASPDIMGLKNKRYINFTEIGDTLKTAIVRKLSGGGNYDARNLFDKTKVKFKLSSTNVLEFNQPPEFDSLIAEAEVRRIKDIFFPVNFVKESDCRLGTTVDGITYLKANRRYETREFMESVKLIFLDILLGAYEKYRDKEGGTGIIFTETEKITKRSEIFLANQNIFKKIFDKNFEKDIHTPKQYLEEKPLKLKEIFDHVQADEDYKNLTCKMKRKYNRDAFYDWMAKISVVKKDQNKCKYIIGYKLNSESTLQTE